LWFGRSPETTQLPSDEDQIAAEVKKCQQGAYEKLENYVAIMEANLHEIKKWAPVLPSGDFSPADPPTGPKAIIEVLLKCLKDCAAKHIFIEVVDIILTYDSHVEQILRNVKILISTTHAANKLFSKLLVGPAKALHKHLQD
jgi:hypothetical protein